MTEWNEKWTTDFLKSRRFGFLFIFLWDFYAISMDFALTIFKFKFQDFFYLIIFFYWVTDFWQFAVNYIGTTYLAIIINAPGIDNIKNY